MGMPQKTYTYENTFKVFRKYKKVNEKWRHKEVILGAAAYQLGNTSSRTITEVKQR